MLAFSPLWLWFGPIHKKLVREFHWDVLVSVVKWSIDPHRSCCVRYSGLIIESAIVQLHLNTNPRSLSYWVGSLISFRRRYRNRARVAYGWILTWWSVPFRTPYVFAAVSAGKIVGYKLHSRGIQKKRKHYRGIAETIIMDWNTSIQF